MFGVKLEGKLDTVIGPETEVKGDISVRGSMRLDGRIEGNVSVMETLFTGSQSVIQGDVHCKDGLVGGRVEGNISASAGVELAPGASVVGDITCKSIVLARGAFLDGRVRMTVEQTPSD